MTISIIGCGDSARDWNKVPVDLSIGLNDCFKFGHQVDRLLCTNAPGRFQPRKDNGYQNRLHTIQKSKPQKFVTQLCDEWRRYFPDNLECISIQPFHKYNRRGSIYFSKTSPFTALSYAYNLGTKDIILWGVDMINHPMYSKGTKAGDFELLELLKFIALLNNDGVRVWIGNKETALNNYLMVYDPEQVARDEMTFNLGSQLGNQTQSCNG